MRVIKPYGETGKPRQAVGFLPELHEEFLDLCALSTSGNLSREEQRKLQKHLAFCPDCREALKEFEALVDRDMPTLAPDLADGLVEMDTTWSVETAEAAFFERLS